MAGGLIVGKEGPLVHVGSCIASILGQGGSERYGLTCRWLRYLKNDRDRRDLVTCGAAAGVAAAFRAPVGGVLFALEEVTSWYLLYFCTTRLPTFSMFGLFLSSRIKRICGTRFSRNLGSYLHAYRNFHVCTPIPDTVSLFPDCS